MRSSCTVPHEIQDFRRETSGGALGGSIRGRKILILHGREWDLGTSLASKRRHKAPRAQKTGNPSAQCFRAMNNYLLAPVPEANSQKRCQANHPECSSFPARRHPLELNCARVSRNRTQVWFRLNGFIRVLARPNTSPPPNMTPNPASVPEAQQEDVN